jgi:hypothetical protein
MLARYSCHELFGWILCWEINQLICFAGCHFVRLKYPQFGHACSWVNWYITTNIFPANALLQRTGFCHYRGSVQFHADSSINYLSKQIACHQIVYNLHVVPVAYRLCGGGDVEDKLALLCICIMHRGNACIHLQVLACMCTDGTLRTNAQVVWQDYSFLHGCDDLDGLNPEQKTEINDRRGSAAPTTRHPSIHKSWH